MRYILFLSVFLIGLTFTSCDEDYLSPAPTAAVGADSYFTTEAQVETGVINMYDGIQGVNILADTDVNKNHSVQFEFYLTEMRSDNTQTKSSEGEAAQFENYTIESTNGIVADYYRSMYNIIYRANVVLENLDAAGGSAGQFEGEAKFVRAYAYFNLVRLFGDVPLVDRVIAPLEKDIQFTRENSDKVYSLITSDLTTAINNLDNTYQTRASKGAAQALLAKVYLTTGNFGEARSLCEAVINSGDYSLESDFRDVFYSEGNNEVIFAVGYVGDDTKDSQNFSAEMLNAVGRTTGVNYVTADAAAFLDENGGNRTMFSYRQDALQPQFNQVVKYLPDGSSELGVDATAGNPTLGGNDWIVIRYADVLLMHVEAIINAGSGVSTTDPAALASFQAVRDRAGLTDPVTSVSKEELLAERRAELAFENHRFFDLVRFGVANDVLSEFAAANGYSFSGTDLLLPIPQREIGLSNGTLTQNPGY